MLMRWSDPFEEVFSLRDAMNRLFNEAFVRIGALGWWSSGPSLPISVLEQNGRYYVKALLPGLKPDQVDITVQGHTITIRGTLPALFSEEELQQGSLLVNEIGTGNFARSFTLPKDFVSDRIEASYDHGMLTLIVPVAEYAQTRRIAIQTQPHLVEAGQPHEEPAQVNHRETVQVG
jgi:HSP20 family protein